MSEERYIYPLIETMSKFYLRLIDDILKKQNKVHPSMKFDFNFSNEQINFLDTVVYKTESGKLETKLNINESDRQVYLHRNSKQLEFL